MLECASLMGKRLIGLLFHLVALALLLVAFHALKIEPVEAQEVALLAVTSDMPFERIFEPIEAEPKGPKKHTRWLEEPKATIAATLKPTPVVKASVAIAPYGFDQLIQKYALLNKVNPSKMAIIAKCESGFRPEAVSRSGLYVGLYQFNPTTWASNRRAMGLDTNPALRANAEEAIKTAAFKMGRDGFGAWPVCGLR